MTETGNRTGAHRAPVRVLVVCTANQCRSPVGEILLQAAAGRAGVPLSVSSAGTHAVAGIPIHPMAERALREHGLDAVDFVSTPLTPSMVEAADLILTAEVEHRRHVIVMSPPALRRTFTMLEWQRLAPLLGQMSHDPREFRAQLPARIAAARGLVQPTPSGDDIADPIGQRYAVFSAMAGQIAGTVDAAVSPFVVPTPG